MPTLLNDVLEFRKETETHSKNQARLSITLFSCQVRLTTQLGPVKSRSLRSYFKAYLLERSDVIAVTAEPNEDAIEVAVNRYDKESAIASINGLAANFNGQLSRFCRCDEFGNPLFPVIPILGINLARGFYTFELYSEHPRN